MDTLHNGFKRQTRNMDDTLESCSLKSRTSRPLQTKNCFHNTVGITSFFCDWKYVTLVYIT